MKRDNLPVALAALALGFLISVQSAVTAEAAEAGSTTVDAGSFVIERTVFKNGEEIRWTVYEVSKRFEFVPDKTIAINQAYLLNPFRTAIEKLDKSPKGASNIELLASGSTVESDDLKGTRAAVFVVEGKWRRAGTQAKFIIPENGCVLYTITEKLKFSSLRAHAWKTFE